MIFELLRSRRFSPLNQPLTIRNRFAAQRQSVKKEAAPNYGAASAA